MLTSLNFVFIATQVSTAGRTDGLEGALLLDECHIPLRECERLDEGLALALRHLLLPPGWSLLGSKLTNSSGEIDRELFGACFFSTKTSHAKALRRQY